MSGYNPFSDSKHDLGIGDEYGFDMHGATENLIRQAYTHEPKCYVCTVSYPQYKIEAKKAKYTNAEIQNGLYICRHCITLKPLDNKKYGIKELG